jgi:hypothetical protein
MPIFNLRRKAGSGQGTPIELNPSIASGGPAAPKKPGFPGGIREALLAHDKNYRDTFGPRQNTQKSFDFLSAAEKSHAAERYQEAAGHLDSARRALPTHTSGPWKDHVIPSYALEQHIENYKKSVNGLGNKPTAEEDWF